MTKLTGSMTPIEKKTALVCACIAAAAVIFCFFVTRSAICALILLAAVVLLGAVLFTAWYLNARRPTYKSRTWAVYFILLAGAASYMYTVFEYDFKASPVNLLFGAETVETYEDALAAAENNHTNTVMEISAGDLTPTDYGYAIQKYKGGTLLDSQEMYKFYIFRFDGRFVLLKADPEYLETYFAEKEQNGDRLTRIYVSEFDRADAGTYDSIYTPTLYLYPGGPQQNSSDIYDDETLDYFGVYHRLYEEYYSDIPLYELDSGFVMTVKEYDLNKQKTIFIGMVLFVILIICAVVTVLTHPENKKTEETNNA